MRQWSYYTPILAYHRVGELKGDHVPTVSAQTFERHLAFLARYRYQVIKLETLAATLEHGQPMPRHTAIITFDDGYEETHRVAWPLLKRFGLAATIFVTPAEVGLPGFVTWQQLQELASDGMTIGSHTLHHSYLPLVEEAQLSQELGESKQLIETHVGQSVELLSYPVGGFTPFVQGVAQQIGYRAACTTNRYAPSAPIDRYGLRRIKVTERDANPLMFLAKVSGYYDLFRQLREPS